MRRVCLVGAGNIARTHAEVLGAMPGHAVTAIVDPNCDAARSLISVCPAATTYRTAEEALAAGSVDVAHVLVPPALHHDLAHPFLVAGKAVLIEKPLAVSAEQCASLTKTAQASAALLGVNQNFVFHPAFVEVRKQVAAGRFGRPRFVDCIYNVPLRQLASRQFGHWMFHQPRNLLLEQAVHPLSQIAAIAGPIQAVSAVAGQALTIGDGTPFHPEVSATLSCTKLPAQLRFAVGQSYPFWQISIVCDDGVVVADILANRWYVHARTRWLDAVDGLLSTGRTAAGLAASGLRNAVDYGLSTLRLRGRSDAFYRSMQGAIAAFHGATRDRPPECDGTFGAMLVGACEQMASTAFGATEPPRLAPAAPALVNTHPDAVVLGGTGFIGTETVRQLVASGRRVRVMARSTRNLPSVFSSPRVALAPGDIRDERAVTRAVEGAPVVVNLAHGGGGADFERIRAAMVGGAEAVARAVLASGAKRLVHVGSIASLYLGADAGVVTGATPTDPLADRRADYARAKAICDRALLGLHASDGLPVVILRPGLVVGEGSSPFHSGLGFYNNEQHCIGWNGGRNALPFVLVSDVAAAILLAAEADGIDGRCYNLVGDVQPSARDYIAELARVTGRPLRYHPQSPDQLWAGEVAKWLVKRVGGRVVPLPSRRDIRSRGLAATFDCSDAKRDLGWQPVADPAAFTQQAIAVHAA